MMQADSIAAEVSGASLINVESPRLLPWLMLCNLIAGFSLALSCFTFYQLTRTEREYALLKNQQEMTNAWIARAGLIRPGDEYNGPEGNFFYKPMEKR